MRKVGNSQAHHVYQASKCVTGPDDLTSPRTFLLRFRRASSSKISGPGGLRILSERSARALFLFASEISHTIEKKTPILIGLPVAKKCLTWDYHPQDQT
jgi:hypothetical protein